MSYRKPGMRRDLREAAPLIALALAGWAVIIWGALALFT